MTIVSLTDVAGHLPGDPVPAEFFAAPAGAGAPARAGAPAAAGAPAGADDALRASAMFKAPRRRHHVAATQSNVDLIERAAQPLIERHGRAEIRAVDVLLVHCQLPDQPFVGAGTEVARRLGLRPEWLIDVANAGCASFVYMLKVARHLLTTTAARSALICNAQTAAGQLFAPPEVRGLAQAAIPGDGCGLGYLTTSAGSPLLDVTTRHVAEHAGDMTLVCDDGRRYFEPGGSRLRVGFTADSTAEVLARGNRLVPEVVTDLCGRLGVATGDIDVLVTNQPNRTFLRNWREALSLPADRHPDTFDEAGNLFGAAIPVTLDRSVRAGRVRDGDLVVLAGFAHAGDFAGAAAVRWGVPA